MTTTNVEPREVSVTVIKKTDIAYLKKILELNLGKTNVIGHGLIGVKAKFVENSLAEKKFGETMSKINFSEEDKISLTMRKNGRVESSVSCTKEELINFLC